MKIAFLGGLISTVFSLIAGQSVAAADAVHFANGLKVGEVTSNSAIVWTRLTEHSERTRSGIEFLSGPRNANPTRDPQWDGSEQIPDGRTLDDMEGSVPGAAGEVRLQLWRQSADTPTTTRDWTAVDPSRDFTNQWEIEGLQAGTAYRVVVEARPAGSETTTAQVEASFKTAPAPDDAAAVDFVVVTCGEYPRRDDPENGHTIYDTMRQMQPDFFVHTGDIEYYDKANPFAPSEALARFKMNRIFAMPFQRAFHNSAASYFMKDDHDTLKNDCWPGTHYGSLTFDQGLAIFREQFPMGEKTYRTFRHGKDLQVWLVEGRDFRSPNKMKDGPQKTIWGDEQKQWLKKTMRESDATFKVLLSPTPIVGPDRESKNDNHANEGFSYEGNQVREFLSDIDNVFVVCGDRHWQYHSVDPETGVREFACGPSANEHAGGFSQDHREPMHRYLKIAGGFLSVHVDREADGTPTIAFRHHAPDGNVRNDETFRSVE